MLKLAPSILSADFGHLAEDVKKIEEGGADYIHVDVMDGHFVPNISFGAPVMKCLNGKTELPYDVHLMIENPDMYIDDFVTPQTEYITVHQEACVHLHRTIQNIKSKGVKAGVSINPATPVSTLECILPDVDLVLIMSVNPGFGGQSFMTDMMDKTRRLRKLLDEVNPECLIEVDGGIDAVTQAVCKQNGVDVMVTGSAYFKASDRAAFVKIIQE